MSDRDLPFLFPDEKLTAVLLERGVRFEVVERTQSLWCGVLGYASNLTDEPDIGRLLGLTGGDWKEEYTFCRGIEETIEKEEANKRQVPG